LLFSDRTKGGLLNVYKMLNKEQTPTFLAVKRWSIAVVCVQLCLQVIFFSSNLL
jgi:hypothetical protein